MKLNEKLADQVDADLQEAVDALVGAAEITRLRAKMSHWQRREFLMQEADAEAKLQDHEGRADLADQLRHIVEAIRGFQPKVVATGQGDMQK